MKRAIFTLVLLLTCFIPALSNQNNNTSSSLPDIPFEELADSFLKRFGLQEIHREPDACKTILNEGYVVLRMGAFDLWYPKYFLQKNDRVKELKALAKTVLELQGTWIDWVGEKETKKSCQKDIKALNKWLKCSNMQKLRSEIVQGEGDGRPDALVMLNASNSVREASDRFSELMRNGSYLGNFKTKEKCINVIFAPDRRNFLELGSFMGSLSSEHENYFWNSGLALWSSLNWHDLYIIALEYASITDGAGDIYRGLRMDITEDTALYQHVVQNTAEYLLKFYYGKYLHPDLVSGVAMNLVIDIYGQNNVRTGGGSSSGNPVAPSRTYLGRTGPSKAKIDALWFDTRWRKNKGQGHFIKELRFAQKKGNKAAAKIKGIYKNKNTCFAIQPGEGAEDPYLVQLPLLMRSAPKKKIPDIYKDDYLEFLRAYRSGFTYWLQTQVESTVQKNVDSTKLFQNLLQRAANPESKCKGVLFEDIVLDIYGKPFSGVVSETESLEKDFVQWLARR